MYYIDKNMEFKFSDARHYIDRFMSERLPRLSNLEKYYKNNNKINNRVFEDKSKPNNKISHSFGNYIVKTNVSMLLGSPISYNSVDNLDDYTQILEDTDEHDINVDLATKAAIYGYAVQLLYLNEEADIKFSALDNKQVVLIYSDDISETLLYVIRFWTTETVDFVRDEYIEIYSAESVRRYKNNIAVSEDENLFDDIPVIVYKNNTECMGDFENVISLIDEYDLLTSDTANENDYFNNAYLYLNTDTVDKDDIAAMKENRVLYGLDLNPAFILKGNSNADLENEKNRTVKDIHKLAFVPDLSDENFANNVSGVAMKYKLFGTLNNIANKQRKFKKALNQRNKLLFDMMYVKSLTVPSYVDIIFTMNLPENSLETAQMINQLRGLVSDETLVSQLPFVQDAAWEVEQAGQTQSIGDIYGEQ